MPRLVSVNSYHYRRGGADAVYFDHAALLESLGWENAYFSMHHAENVDSQWSRYFVDEIDIGKPYPLGEKIVKATQVVYSWEARRRLRELLRDFPADVAHLHNIYHHQSPSILPVFAEFGVPVVMTAHDLKIACPNNKMLNDTGICERCRGGRFHNVVRHRCIHGSVAASAVVALEAVVHGLLGSYRRHVAGIVVPSRFYLEKFVEWGWPRERFRYIPNYVDAARFEPEFRPGDYLLYFGRLAAEKGVLTLVEAAARAGVRLVIAGTGPLQQALASRLESLAGRHQIEMVGFKSGQALHDLIRGARAVVLPSEWYENAPISVLEAFAMGKPVIGARIGGIPEPVREDESGWLFPSGDVDALATALATVDALPAQVVADHGRRARAIVEAEFSRRRYVDETLALYREVGVRGVPAAVGA